MRLHKNVSFSYQFHRFQSRNLWCTFQTLLARKRGLAHVYFLDENESFQRCLSYDNREMAKLLSLKVRF